MVESPRKSVSGPSVKIDFVNILVEWKPLLWVVEFLFLLSLRFHLLVVFPLFSFESMQHISGHAGLSHKRECLFKAQQETWIPNYNQFTFSFMRKTFTPPRGNKKNPKIQNLQTYRLTVKPIRLACVKLGFKDKDMNAYLIYTTHSSQHAVECHTE